MNLPGLNGPWLDIYAPWTFEWERKEFFEALKAELSGDKPLQMRIKRSFCPSVPGLTSSDGGEREF